MNRRREKAIAIGTLKDEKCHGLAPSKYSHHYNIVTKYFEWIVIICLLEDN